MDESSIRLSFFLVLLIILTLAQQQFPRRKPQYSTAKRWLTNFSLVVIDSLLVRGLLGTILPVAIASWAQEHQLGLFNQFPLFDLLAIALSIIILDGLIYWQHRLFHQVPLLWRLHRVQIGRAHV